MDDISEIKMPSTNILHSHIFKYLTVKYLKISFYFLKLKYLITELGSLAFCVVEWLHRPESIGATLICQTQCKKPAVDQINMINLTNKHTVPKEANDFKTKFATQNVCLCSGLAAPRARLQHLFLEQSVNPTG